MLSDAIIAEVRKVREEHAAKFNYDLRAIYEDYKKLEIEYAAAGYKFANIPSPSADGIRRKRRTRASSSAAPNL